MTVKRERTRSTARKRQNCFRGSRVRRDSPSNFDPLLEESLGYKDDVVGPQFHVWIVLWGPQNLIKVKLHPHLFFAFRPQQFDPTRSGHRRGAPYEGHRLGQGQVARVLDGPRGPDLTLDVHQRGYGDDDGVEGLQLEVLA